MIMDSGLKALSKDSEVVYTAIMVQQTRQGLIVLGSKAMGQAELDMLVRSGCVALQRHIKCPRLITLIMNDI